MSMLVMWSMHVGLMTASVQVSCNQRGRNASQLNIGGTGLGSFNDRFRDAVVGGSPFASPLFQGWVNGLSSASNQYMQDEMSGEEQKELLLQYSDQLRLSMAGNLEDYQMEDHKVLCLPPACRTSSTICLSNCTKCSSWLLPMRAFSLEPALNWQHRGKKQCMTAEARFPRYGHCLQWLQVTCTCELIAGPLRHTQAQNLCGFWGLSLPCSMTPLHCNTKPASEHPNSLPGYTGAIVVYSNRHHCHQPLPFPPLPPPALPLSGDAAGVNFVVVCTVLVPVCVPVLVPVPVLWLVRACYG